MAHTNETTYLKLSQFVRTDRPSFLFDYNGDMKKIDDAFTALASSETTVEERLDDLATKVDEAKQTAQEAKTAATSATSEADGAVAIANNAYRLAGDAQVDAHAALSKANTVEASQGTLSALKTEAKDNLVAAINELYDLIQA